MAAPTDTSFFGSLKAMADAVKSTADAIDAVVRTIDNNATRSVVLEISNTTNRTLTLQGQFLDHGVFREPPPFSIAPRSSGLCSAQSSGLGTGTEGNVRYVFNDDAGNELTVNWDNPFAGSNASDSFVTGATASQYESDHVTGGGNTKAHMRYLVGALVDSGPRQADWKTCEKCKLLFFTPHVADSSCPADGGNHAANSPDNRNIRLPFGIDGPHHQSRWQPCGNCDGLFFNGDEFHKGVCSKRTRSRHEAAGIRFFLPHDRSEDSTHQNAWRHCVKCFSLFFEGQVGDSHCPLDGGTHAAAPNSLVFQLPHDIPEDATHQTGWITCGKCKTMFFGPQEGDSDCPLDGGRHAQAGWTFSLPHGSPEPGPSQPDWSTCHKCKSMFFDGDPNAKGICAQAEAAPSHQAVGLDFRLPFDIPEPGQDKWRFCRDCFGLFFEPHNADGHCVTGGNHLAEGFNFRLDAQ
ncbi:hypothetical protein [Streptomyces avermitilis]|uniref:hypothetical protein n=1 Tax=Streptomyces avermitilis TaxID=33903 RepID=UPI00371EF8B2